MLYRYRILFTILIAVCLLWGLSRPGLICALEAKISDFFITHNSRDVLVYFTVKDCFTKKMEEAILAGIPTSFTFFVEMNQERLVWDNSLVKMEIRHTIKYDNVRKLFYVTYSEQGSVPGEFRDFASAKRAMVEVNGLAVSPLKALQRESQYYVRVKVKLDKVQMPLIMEYVLFFVSMWDFETEWYRQGFVYK
jgi:hypothetical protein